MRCPICRAENSDDAGVCWKCGASFDQVIATQRVIRGVIGSAVGFVVMVVGILLIGTSQRVSYGFSYKSYYWNEAQLEWGILLTLLGAILLLVALVSIVVTRRRKVV